MMLPFLVSTPVLVVAIIEKEILVATVRSKSYRGYTKARKGTFEPIPPREWARIPPLLSVK